MLVIIRKNNILVKKFVDKEKGFSFSFFEIDNNLYLKLKKDYLFLDGSNSVKIVNNKIYKIKNNKLFYNIELSFYEFSKYSYQKIANEKKLDFHLFVIKNKHFLYKYGEIFLNTNKITNDYFLKDGDIIDFQQYRIIYHSKIILVSNNLINNNNFNQKFSFKINKYDFLKNNNIVDKPNLILNSNFDKQTVKEERSFLLQLGPVFTMSLVSLITAFFNFYINLDKGRNFFENIIAIIFPISMFLSLVFWQSINYIVIKKKKQKELIEKEKERKKIIHKIKNNIQSYKNQLILYTKNIYCNDFKNLNYRDEALINLGYYNYLINCEIEINELKKELVIEDYPYLFNIFKENLSISCKNINYYFNYIYLQLLMICDPNKIKFSIYANQKFIDENYYLYKDIHFIYDNQRMIFDEELNFLQCKNKLIVFVIGDFEVKERENCHYIYFNSKNIKPNINYLNDVGVYYDGDREIKLCIKNFKYDIKIVDKINTLSLKENKEKKFLTFHSKDTNKKGIIATIGYCNNKHIELNLDDDKDGPHGLVVGTTGSGKSELLISLCLSLVYNYSPKELNLVIIDFKGSGIVQSLMYKNKTIPHLISHVSNIDILEFEKIIISFKNECIRRQEKFRICSLKNNVNVSNLEIYRKYNDDIKYLVVVVDEFAELKKTQPEFIQEIISISRIGRSLGLKLILSSQSVSGVIDEQIKLNTNFKIALKLNSKSESKEVIGSDDSYYINEIGQFNLKSSFQERKGYSIYANSNIADTGSGRVDIVDKNFNTLYSNNLQNNLNINESKAISKYLIEKYPNFKKESLWFNDIPEINFFTIPKVNYKYDNIYFGIVDDYYQNKQYYASISMFQNSLIISKNQEIKQRFIKLILLNIYLNFKNHTYILCNFLKGNYDCFQNTLGNNTIINFQNDDINYLVKLLLKKPNIFNKNTIIIIDDYYNFFEFINKDNYIIKNILENSSKYNFKLIFFTNNYHNINFQIFNYIDNTITVSKLGENDLSSIFNKKLNSNIKDTEGYFKINKILRYRLFSVGDFNLVKFKESSFIKNKPGKIEVKLFENQLYLGIELEFFDYIIHNFNVHNCLIITSFNDNLLKKYQLKLNDYKQNIIFMDYKEYEKKYENFLNIPLLFIGSGILKQYTINYNKEIKNNQGIYICDEKSVLIEYE